MWLSLGSSRFPQLLLCIGMGIATQYNLRASEPSNLHQRTLALTRIRATPPPAMAPSAASAVGVAHELRPTVVYRPHPARFDEPITAHLRHPSGWTGAAPCLWADVTRPVQVREAMGDGRERGKLGERRGSRCLVFSATSPGLVPPRAGRVGRGRRPPPYRPYQPQATNGTADVL